MSRAIKNRVKNVVKTGDATALENMLIEDLTGINERDFVSPFFSSSPHMNLVGNNSVNVCCHGEA
jgi:hypothetical protein